MISEKKDKKKITILIHDLSKNGVVRVYPIAKVLEKFYNIEIIAFYSKKNIFSPYLNEFKYKLFKCPRNNILFFLFLIPSVLKAISGDIIYAFKPRLASFGIALLYKLFLKPNFKIILDNEDWEAEKYFLAKNKLEKLRLFLKNPFSIDNQIYLGFLEKKMYKADEIFAVSSFLENRMGGTRLLHGADCSFFDPKIYDRVKLRKKWNVSDKKVVLFAGTVFPHKGLENIIDALNSLEDKKYIFMIVGVKNKFLNKLKKYGGEKIVYAGSHPHSKMPDFLSLSDIVVILLEDTPHAQAQVPAKVFEAMAMEKAIIASKISDLPDILKNCGVIINNNSVNDISNSLQKLSNDSVFRKKICNNARKKCIEQYSWDAMEKILLKVFNKYLG